MILRNILLAPVMAIAIGFAAQAAEPVVLPSGTQVEDLEPGTGAEARSGQTVTVHYTGWLYENEGATKKFDSSQGAAPFTFRLGAGDVINGWDVGVVGMKVGGVRSLIIPPGDGYGAEGDGPIPPNSWLIFEVELLGVK